ncbi:MAG: ABC transporter substrate-binding protein [Syntrophomonadaceae bacterium]|jgi:NitT/TauT family transport system substrate-binding protein|nr:ABC transporter substrate-binding protein [Syntrophomonadaceae bacterium]
MKRFRFFGLVLLLIVALASGLVAGCGGSEEPAEQEAVKFKIGHCTWVGYGPLYIAEEKGFFANHNIHPEMVVIEDESQYAAAILADEIQALGNVVDREVIHYANGAPISFVCAMDQSYGGDGIIASADVQSVADLAGKTVGLDKSSTSYFFFLAILDKYDVDESTIDIQEMTAGDAGAAFVAGRLDAAVAWEPWLTNAGQREGGHVLASSRDFPGMIVDVISMRQDFIEQNPEAVQGLVDAWNEAIAFYKENPEEGNKIMAGALGLTEEEITEMAGGVQFMGQAENLAFFDPEPAEGTIYSLSNLALEFWADKGIIDTEVKAEEIINPDFVQASK